ncbi:MAG: MBL fold metallo-hydrolase [Candidatus Infernicultor aquiphilus]|uniref:MBL fold metallo-hydrolase n=1 Tax=Candidatus Infernicultor aquiphilus TaxID=1805029 RepID=A0A1J5GUC6_9BACT|nr:MBL fold metallo-hydrolase [bacterium]OIP70592.1 MAG: MBL fold metallo-hydrolase [Candidatus Atribacteria bacterium CG2_30_33_13]PIU25534.1 MAG: MBL fold metallo-hydrolase [Candidatus Atribacteria bacterium CG08_land_8_20_14_0_20_33_29]PIW11566.1 MAG: MBL fold metallo-hydrolase [Candidatus Atribacteria bacterium CG17_big_fil_post_rev_8_21_14_2_50_34_11]PIX34578.1 MAG: MBL fold metallo-hydrolase [Candidatus Atribacteria bacterium CG_4_8_14_3_um_filter_34_18]PIY33074.1 MAG: MBL fold metallo-h
MKIKWLGHSSFLIESERGIKIITDPFDETLGYKMPRIKVNIVTVSHEHFDHNFVRGMKGKPVVFKGLVKRESHKMEFRGISSYHDSVYGGQRGPNTIFVIKADGLNLCHLGDLGHILSSDKLTEIGSVDILFIPVGGFYTIDSNQATQIIKDIKPKIAIPMHYKTRAIKFSIDPVEIFLSGKDKVKRLESSEFEIKSETLPKDTHIYVLQYE